MKTCSKCKVEKDVGEFSRDKSRRDGLRSQCKACFAAYQKSRSFEPRIEGAKTCSKCKVEKERDQFHRCKRNGDGLQTQCKACKAAYGKSRSFEPRTEGTKTCSKCGKDKPVAEFYCDKNRRDGLTPQCKACQAECRNSRSFEPRTEGTKTCSKCSENKPVAEFYHNKGNRDGLTSDCKACQAEYKKSLSFGPITAGTKTCGTCGTDKPVAEFFRDKGNRDGLTARCKACDAVYKAANKDKINAYQRHRRNTDPRYALCKRARRSAGHALKGRNAPGFFRHMPYTQDEFTAHLIATLPPGTDPAEVCDGRKWHIDHIRPMASFRFEGGKDGEDWQRCWALANLRMLPAAENIAKGDSLSERPTPGECPVQDWIWETERTNKTDDDTHVGEILSNLFDTLDTGRESADTTRGNSAV